MNLGLIKILIINKKTEEFYLLMNRELVWKDLEIKKIFHIKKMILFQIAYSSVYKISSKTVIKGAELNPNKMSEKNIESLEESWKKKFFKRNF